MSVNGNCEFEGKVLGLLQSISAGVWTLVILIVLTEMVLVVGALLG
jgi:hypothetical protein